ncbi:Cullin repeat-like-containing domain protein [Calycina marina]|uniref:Exocyst complex protein EXO70 n=1 Tax=Calycina marina TaxID=1763456 RepID=A0A9P8CCH0_9HELO|nr:Cullin repeat-like-containing domain protein [Calycina marina]
MALGLGHADEEARAEVEVLNSRLEKTRQLNKKIQASLNRLETNGKSMQEAIGPIYQNTKRLQALGNNLEEVLAAIERMRQPSDVKSNEEAIIKKGPARAGLSAFLSSVKRVNVALIELKRTNLRSNQATVADLQRLVTSGSVQLESYYETILKDNVRPVETLHYITHNKPFPVLDQNKTTRLGLITSHLAWSARQVGYTGELPVLQIYASARGPYLVSTLQILASASVNTARKKEQTTPYRSGTNGITSYAMAIEYAFLAEYDNICSLFQRDEWGRVFNLTCQGAMAELRSTLKDLDSHIKSNLNTDCYLAYEIIQVISGLSANIESRTGELKDSFAKALKLIKDTGKQSLGELLEDTRRRVLSLQVIPPDGGLPVTSDAMIRLQTMVEFLPPISSIMISLGDGGWKSAPPSSNSNEQIPSLASFDVTADGKQIFAHYCIDTIDNLLSSLQQKGKSLIKGGNGALGVFIMNNVTVVDRMIRNSELQPLLASRMADVDKWRKTGASLYTGAWREPSAFLLDVQYTNRTARPQSGSAASIDSVAVVKALSNKEKEAIKEKFKGFNTSFEALIKRHKELVMDREVREGLSKQVQQMLEPLYCRFWDRYHEIDKGKGKYVKYNKTEISGVFIDLNNAAPRSI